MSKTIKVADAVARIPDGAVLMIGGFMGVGTPHRLVAEIVRQRKKGLTVIANDTAKPGLGIGLMISAGLVARVIVSHIGTNPETQAKMIAGEIEVELVPQGTLIERIRAGGFGLGAATPLVIAAYASRTGFARLKGWALGHSGFLRHGFGLVAMLSGIFIATGADKLIATQVLAMMPDQWLELVTRD